MTSATQWRGLTASAIVATLVAAACDSSAPKDTSVAPGDAVADFGRPPSRIRADSEPTIFNLEAIVRTGVCTRLDRMPLVLAQLEDPDFRFRLASVVAEGGRPPAEALTEWLVLAHAYQEICDLRGDETTAAKTYVTESVPLRENTIDAALASGRCTFLVKVDELAVWPYEVRMGHEVLGRQFEQAEITRRLWLDVLAELGTSCGDALDRRGRIRLEAERERLGRIVGLDDPTLIDLRTKMLEALEAGEEGKVLAYAKAVSDREKALDSRRAAAYDAKLAEIEKKIAEQGAKIGGDKVVAATQQAADASANVADTARNVAATAEATKAAVGVLRALF